MALSTEQQKQFEAQASRLGFQSGEHTSALGGVNNLRKSSSGVTVLAADPAKTTLPHKLIALGSIDELKKVVGASNDNNDDHITYPESTGIDPNTAKRDLTSDQIHHLKRLAHSYVYGKSHKISEEDKALINNTLFPSAMAAYSEPNYTVKSGEILRIEAGTVANYGILTVEKGGQILVVGDGSMTCQQFIQES